MKKNPAIALTLLVSALTSALDLPSGQPSDLSCKYEDHKKDLGTSFDLSPLMEFSKNTLVSDKINFDTGEYQYLFSLCSTVPYNDAKLNSACTAADGSSKVQHNWSPVWQTKNDLSKDDCFYLAHPGEDKATWSLMNPENPAHGVSIQYTDGQSCTGGRRSMTFNFTCVNHAIAGADTFKAVAVDEVSKCRYSIAFESPYACPTQCGFGGGRTPCGDHGICGYDSDAKTSRCFCNDGYTGSGCGDSVQSADDNNYGAVLGLLIFVVIALVAFGAGGYFLFRWLQSRTMNMRGDSYSKLEAAYGDSMVQDNDHNAPSRMGVSTGQDSNI